MLNTIEFRQAPANFSPLALGVLVSECRADANVEFSVPAHVMATLNVVRHGALLHENRCLPACFATGAHTRSRRYVITAGAHLLTLFCRAEALKPLCGATAGQLSDRWLAAEEVFGAWARLRRAMTESTEPADIAGLMLECVGPDVLRAQLTPAEQRQVSRLQRAAAALNEHVDASLATVAATLGMSERSVQRLFGEAWGVTPKLVQRMLRIQRGMALWQQKPKGLAQLAMDLGLSDQAHLAREFRELVGSEPRTLKSLQADASDDSDDDPLWALRTGSSLLLPLLLSDSSKTAQSEAPSIRA